MTHEKFLPNEAESHSDILKDYYKRHLEVVCNNATLAIFIMDEHQQCVYMNPAAEKLTGFCLDEVRGRALHDLIHHTRPDGSHYPLDECPIDRAFPQNNQEQGEEVFVHKNGSFYPVAYTASPIREGDGIVGTIVEVRNITQEKLDEKARQELEQARTNFFSNVSHEFRTPLTLMLGTLEEILVHSEISECDRQQVEMAHRNSLRLLQLVNTLLDFSRIEAGRTEAFYEPTDLAKFTSELASTFRSAVERAGMRLIVDCPPLPELVYVDQEMWEKIVFNLLSNAFKFTFTGEIRVSLRLSGDRVELAVQDTGVGIPADEIPHLFERFHRVKEVQGRSYEGSGIGLSLVQELVHLHGGTVAVTSTVGQGSCFTISIPTGSAHLAQDRIGTARQRATIANVNAYVNDAHQGQSTALPEPRHKAARILLVDDNADMRDYVKRLLNRYVVETARDGSEALQAIAHNPPDLVLTDVMMPGIDGFELLRKLRANPKTSAIPIILLSARAGEESRVEGLEAGADDYLVKPFSTRELLARVEANLNMARLRREAAQREYELRIVAETASDRLETVLASINDVFMVFDRDWRYTYVNQRTIETSGIRREDFLSKTLWDVFPDLVGTEFYQKLHDAVATQTPVQFEYFYSVWNRWFENRVYPTADGASMFVTEITDRKQAEAALTQSEVRFRQMAETIQDVFWLWNPQQQRLLYVSPAYERIWQRPCASLYDDMSQWLDTVHPDDRERVKTAMERCLISGYLDQEYRVVRPDGSICWVRDRGYVLYDNGEPCRVAGVAQDITDRKQAEAALQQSEAQFRQLANAMPQIVWIANAQGEPEFVNQQWVEYTGLTLSQTSDQLNVFQTIHPDDIAPTYEVWESCLATGSLYQTEFRLKRATGDDYRWFLCRAVPICDSQAQIVRWYGTLTDIDDRKRAERDREQFFARQQKYAQQLQGLTKAALAINTARSIKDVLDVITEQAYRIVGTHQAITSMTVDHNWSQAINAIHLSDKYAQWRNYDQMPDGSGIYALVCQMNRPIRMTQAELESHPHWQGFSKAAVNHPPMRGWLAAPLVGRDGNNIGLIQLSDKYAGEFTEEDEAILVQLAQMASVAVENARLYEAEQQAREEAETANRIKDEFLAVLSHELRSPLNPILGWVKLLQSRKFDAQATAKALETIERNAKLQTQLIEDLLDVSRILRGKMVLNVNTVNLVTTIEAALETVRLAAAAKQIQIQTVFDTNAALVSGDASRLQQVLWNLLSNAVKFTPAGGRIDVQLQLVGADAQIRVQDTGIGINPDFLPYVFEYFRQEDGKTTRKFGGLGLGLAIVRQITELHGGTVTADSLGEGQGATFSVQLPLLPSQSQHEDREPIPLSSFIPNRLQGIQVLVVDDELDMRELVLVILEQYGANVKIAASATEALALLDTSQPDVLISDIGMPDIDGYMFMRQVRMRSLFSGGQIPAIALTAYAGEFDQQQALAVGFQQHLSKPVEPEQLVQTIVDLIG